MRVALADDSALFRTGLATLLRTGGAEVLVEASTVPELFQQLAVERVDAVVLDIRMPPTFTDEGIGAAEKLHRHHPEVGTLILSTYTHPDYAVRLLADGRTGVGYLLKDRVDDVGTLMSALERLVRGETVIDSDIVTRLLRRQHRRRELDMLTDREREVLRLIAEGRSNNGIAGQLYLSTKTVEATIASVFAKLGLSPGPADNRRVLASLSWLRFHDEHPSADRNPDGP